MVCKWKFARYAKYIGYYTDKGKVLNVYSFARYAKYIGYYTKEYTLCNNGLFARYAKYIGYYTNNYSFKEIAKFARYDDVILHLLIIFWLGEYHFLDYCFVIWYNVKKVYK